MSEPTCNLGHERAPVRIEHGAAVVVRTIVLEGSHMADLIATAGVRVDIVFPSGQVADLWLYEDFSGCASVDVRRRTSIESTESAPLVRALSIPSTEAPKCVVAVLSDGAS